MNPKRFILSLEGVHKSFDGFKAIDDLNFYMDEGELRVIIGPNGAGKSTMLDIITGRTRPDKGKVEFGMKTDLTKLNEYQSIALASAENFRRHPFTWTTACSRTSGSHSKAAGPFGAR